MSEPSIFQQVENADLNVAPVANISWDPKEDITAHELSLCTPLLIAFVMGASNTDLASEISELPNEAARHFEVD